MFSLFVYSACLYCFHLTFVRFSEMDWFFLRRFHLPNIVLLHSDIGKVSATAFHGDMVVVCSAPMCHLAKPRNVDLT